MAKLGMFALVCFAVLVLPWDAVINLVKIYAQAPVILAVVFISFLVVMFRLSFIK